jgi:hypothetical protein
MSGAIEREGAAMDVGYRVYVVVCYNLKCLIWLKCNFNYVDKFLDTLPYKVKTCKLYLPFVCESLDVARKVFEEMS